MALRKGLTCWRVSGRGCDMLVYGCDGLVRLAGVFSWQHVSLYARA